MRVFWEKGYEGTSLHDLTEAMGINRPSLYAAFGNKEELFLKTVDRYMERAGCEVGKALSAPTAREAITNWLHMSLRERGEGDAQGCLLVQGALACSDDSQRVRKELALRRAAGELAIRARLEQAVAAGDLSSSADPAALAKYFATFQQGLAVQLNAGASCRELTQAIDIAMAAFPS